MFKLGMTATVILKLVLVLVVGAGLTGTCGPAPDSRAQMAPVRIQYLAHSSFLLTSSTGLRVLMDPYNVAASMSYAPVDEVADIVTVSHEHGDHNNTAAVKGNPEIIRTIGTRNIKGIEFRSIATWHDSSQGAQRGQNRVVCFVLDGVSFCHLGDLGHRLSPEQVAEIGRVDVLFIPVGGNFTIDAKTATQVVEDLKPRLTIPMHYRTVKVGLNLAPVDDFLAGKQNVKKYGASVVEVGADGLPGAPEVLVLEPSK